MTEDNLHTKVDLENGSPAFAKPVLYAGAVEKARISIYNEDCLQALKAMADKQFDLAIVDPPYGLNIINSGSRFKQYNKKNWDNEIPTPEYFEELFRVSKEQIIFGGNYFSLPANKCFLIWDKIQPEGVSFAMAE